MAGGSSGPGPRPGRRLTHHRPQPCDLTDQYALSGSGGSGGMRLWPRSWSSSARGSDSCVRLPKRSSRRSGLRPGCGSAVWPAHRLCRRMQGNACSPSPRSSSASRDTPRQHPRDERRQLSARPKPRPKGRSRHLIIRHRIGLAGQRAMARASYVVSARAMALGTLPPAWFCAATWSVFAPALTLLGTRPRRVDGRLSLRRRYPERLRRGAAGRGDDVRQHLALLKADHISRQLSRRCRGRSASAAGRRRDRRGRDRAYRLDGGAVCAGAERLPAT